MIAIKLDAENTNLLDSFIQFYMLTKFNIFYLYTKYVT